MAGKPFSRKLYNDDDNAKDRVVEWLKKSDWDAWINPDQYGIDVLAYAPNGDSYAFEVEVKHNWKGPRFQYSTLHYSDRKRKFLTTPDTIKFITLNHERTHALIVPGPVLSVAPTIVKDTIYTNNEKFIEVKTADCDLVDLESSYGN
jgi:hypothetical protein